MSLKVHFKKDLESFALQVAFCSDARRIGILGASGCGKSMTLKTIAGIVTPDEGSIEVDGRILFDSDRKINIRTQKRNVGYLFQNYALFPTMSVQKNIEAGLSGTGEARRERAAEMIRKFHLEGLEQRLPGELSGGQQQRVALARIMAYSPDVILLDEPFSALDIYLKDRMQVELAQQLEDYTGTIVMVTHDRDEVYRFCEDLIIMDQGQAVTYGDTKEIFANPRTKAAAMLTGCKNFSGARRIDDHTLEALDWGITLHTKMVLPEGFQHLGYRAHEFIPVWGDRQENCLRVDLHASVRLQFEKNYYIRPEIADAPEDVFITWFVQRNLWQLLEERGLPDYLQLRERDMLFLQ